MEQKNNLSFIKSLKITCTSVNDFIFFIKQPFYLAILHLFLLIVISNILIVTTEYFYNHEKINLIGESFDNTFGDFKIDNKGISFEKKIDSESEHFLIFPGVSFDYFPTKSAFNDTELYAEKAISGIQLDKNTLIFWTKHPDGYILLPIIAPEGLGIESKAFLEPNLKSVRNRAANITFDNNQEIKYNSLIGNNFKVSELISGFFVSFLFMNIIISVISIFILVLAIGSIFALSSYFFANKAIRILFPFNRTLIQIIYATFPPIILATIYAMLNLNFLGFTYSEITIYGLIFYSFFIQAKIQRKLVILKMGDRS